MLAYGATEQAANAGAEALALRVLADRFMSRSQSAGHPGAKPAGDPERSTLVGRSRRSAMLSSVKASRTKDPRPTLAAYGAPLPVTPRMDMALEEAVARALVAARREPTLALVLTVVVRPENRGRLSSIPKEGVPWPSI